LLERDVKEATKRKRRRPRKHQTHPCLAEDRRRLYGHYAIDGGAQSRRHAVFLQLPQDVACYVC